MSKSISGLFAGTIGHKKYYANMSALSKALHNNIIDWSKNQKVQLAKISKTKADNFNTSTIAYDSETGQVYYGMNKGIKLNNSPKNPLIFGDNKHKGLLPKESLNKYQLGNCAEVDAINNALNNGSKLKNISIYTIHTTKYQFGMNKQACENCTYAFKDKIKHNFTGWSK